MPENEPKINLEILPKKKLTVDVDRRKFMGNGMSLGALTLLTGCDISDNDTVQKMFAQVSRWNNFVQGELFSGTKLAPEYPESMAVKDFRYNAWYHAPDAPVISATLPSRERATPARVLAIFRTLTETPHPRNPRRSLCSLAANEPHAKSGRR